MSFKEVFVGERKFLVQQTVRVALEKAVHFIAVWGLDLTLSLIKYAYLVIEFNLQILHIILKTH